MRIAIVGSVADRCINWVKRHHPLSAKITDLDDAEIVFSVFYPNLFPAYFVKSKRKIYNFHGGILPYYRGAGTYAWAIINGEKETGVTLHLVVDGGIDNGEIIDIQKFPITDEDTAETLYKKGQDVIFRMFIKRFNKMLTGKCRTTKAKGEGKLYQRKDLQEIKDLTKYVRALTFEDKEPAFFVNKKGEKIYLKWQ